MKVTEIKTLLPYLTFSIPIGVGTTAVCFLRPNNNVLKLFYNSANTQKLFENRDMIEHLTFLSTLSNSSYDGPTEILVKNDKVIGYIYPFIYMRTLSKMPDYTSYIDIIKNYGLLMSDVRKMSNKNFRLYDVHYKNILFEDKFKLIDIDKGFVDLNTDTNTLFIDNMRQVTKVIIEQIFDLKIDEHLTFENRNFQNEYYDVLYHNPYEVLDFIKKLFYHNDTKDDVKKQIKIKVHKEDNSYHQMF